MFKKIFFFLFFISSVSIPGYYFYQRNKSKKEESYPVNNKEEVQEEEEEEIQEETEEAALVEINGWLDCLLLNTIFFFLMTGFFYLLFRFKRDMVIVKELNDKVTDNQLKNFFFTETTKAGYTQKKVNDEISNLKQQLQGFDPKKVKDKKLEQLFNDLGRLYVKKYCFNNNKFFISVHFLKNFINSELNDGHLNLEMNFPRIFFIISFIIIQILLRYDLYFFLKSFWQVGFSKTFENLHWLDLFSITKVFRRNSIIKKIAFLVALIFITGITFVLASKVYEEEHILKSAERILWRKIFTNREFNSFLSPDEVQRIHEEALDNLTKK